MPEPKKNCWEIKNCGREPGGPKARELGVCSATTETSSEGLNGGKNGGRICWAVAGTLCGGKIQGTFAEKQTTCMSCHVFRAIKVEEGPKFQLMKQGQKYSREKITGK